MKNLLLCFVILAFLNVVVCVAQTSQNKELTEKIDRMYELDQKVQTDIISAIQKKESKEKIKELEKQLGEALDGEDYEKAARIRDEINRRGEAV